MTMAKQEFINILNPNNHFRHECELITQKKGGYLEAEVQLPYHERCYIELSLASKSEHSQCHPNLIHIAIKKAHRRTKQQMKEGVGPELDHISVKEWRIVLQKDGAKATPVKLDPKCTFPEVQVSCLTEYKEAGYMVLKLGSEGLNMTIVQTILKPDGKSISAMSVLNDISCIYPESLSRKPVKAIMDGKDFSPNEAKLRVKLQTTQLSADHKFDTPEVDILSHDLIRNSKTARTAPVKVVEFISNGKFCQGRESQVLSLIHI